MNMLKRIWAALTKPLSKKRYSSSLDRLDDQAQADAIGYRQRSGL